MKSNLQKKTLENSGVEFADFIIDAICEKKGKEIVRLDLRELPEAVCDHFIICEGTSSTQVKAIGDFILYTSKKERNELPIHTEGFGNQEWVLLDYFNVVVHIFLKEKRDFYRLEDLWSDALTFKYKDDGSLIS